MKDKYSLNIQNVGEHDYMVMSKGHHDPLAFMKAVRKEGYDWPLGHPKHVWLKAVPNDQGGTSYHPANKATIGAFPATLSVEAYGDDQYQQMILWTGKNLLQLIEFTGKSEKFDQWFPTWEDFEKHVAGEGYTFKIIRDSGNEVAKVGDWIFKDAEGLNRVLHAC